MTILPDEFGRAPSTRSVICRILVTSGIARRISQFAADLLPSARPQAGRAIVAESRVWFCNKVRRGLLFRVTASAVLAFEMASCLNLHVPAWAVLTAIVVTQLNVGRSLKASFDYLAGTIGGAVCGAAIGLLVGAESELSLLLGLAICVGPLALIANMRQSMTAAPLTAAIVLLSTHTHASPVAAAADRVLEVALGALIGLTTSFVLLPSSAYDLASEVAARTLERLATAAGELMTGLKHGLRADEHHRIQEGIGESVMQLNLFGAEAERERVMRLARAPETGPLLRSLLRLRHDFVLIGRAAASPLPQVLQTRLELHAEVGTNIADFLQQSGAALLGRRRPPSLHPVESALQSYAAAIERVRQEGLTRSLPSEVTERFFALCFALEQLRHNLRDLHGCVAEWAQLHDQTSSP